MFPDKKLKEEINSKEKSINSLCIIIIIGSFEAPLSTAKAILQSKESKYQVETALEMWNSFTSLTCKSGASEQ